MMRRCRSVLPLPAMPALNPALLLAPMLIAWAGSVAQAKEKTPNAKTAPAQVGSVDASGAYRMSAEELGYDCKRLTGRMQVRLLQTRDYKPGQNAPSAISQGVRSVADPVAGVLLGKATVYGADRDKQHANDVAMLRAYNAQLASKGCRTFNLDAELKTDAKGPLPTSRTQPK